MRAMFVLAALLQCASRPAFAAGHAGRRRKWMHVFQFAGYDAAQEPGHARDAGPEVARAVVFRRSPQGLIATRGAAQDVPQPARKRIAPGQSRAAAIRHFNPHFAANTGYTSEEAIGLMPQALGPGLARKAACDRMRRRRTVPGSANISRRPWTTAARRPIVRIDSITRHNCKEWQ